MINWVVEWNFIIIIMGKTTLNNLWVISQKEQLEIKWRYVRGIATYVDVFFTRVTDILSRPLLIRWW
jgi:hypothetical protein